MTGRYQYNNQVSLVCKFQLFDTNVYSFCFKLTKINFIAKLWRQNMLIPGFIFVPNRVSILDYVNFVIGYPAPGISSSTGGQQKKGEIIFM